MADVTIKPIHRILVANRGEIARRVFRTARDMGIATVAVFADSDASAPFVQEADVGIALDGRTSRETYLNIEKVIDACKVSGADAVHPGYGFLSENADFAQAVIDAGLAWVGPPVGAIRQMGDKLAAKAVMSEAGVPTLSAVEISNDTDLSDAAGQVGYPLLVKASAGGGGRGMRVVSDDSELESAVDGARREAAAAFGDDTIFFERWVESSRHVEIQILGDQYGNLVHFFERECSIQRRHQKIIEEAPSPAIDAEMRASMGASAIAAAGPLQYSSAGTVEFLVAGSEYWFLEVNTRLQVEHPVTEAITGFDLVREQIRVAEGEVLGYEQDDLSFSGHAIEARLYAENPARDFLPSPGTISVWQPSTSARFDSGVETGSEVSVEFDPMIAKVIAHAPTRREAAAKLARSLETTRIQGITHNRDFLVATLRTPEFIAGDTTTDFIERVSPPLSREPTQDELIDASVAATLFSQSQRRHSASVLSNIRTGWRNSHMPPERVRFVSGDEEIAIEYRSTHDGRFEVDAGGRSFSVRVSDVTTDHIDLLIDQRRMTFSVTPDGDVWMTHGPSGDIELTEQPRFIIPGADPLKGGLTAPMPGKVLATEVAPGDVVTSGQLLVIIEAMKMEHRVTAPIDGTVQSVRVAVGDQVDKDAVLIEMADSAEGDS